MAKTPTPATTTNPSTLETPKFEALKVYRHAKVVHLYAGVDLMGSKTSSHFKDSLLEVTDIGVIIHSKKTRRIVLIPYSNVKGLELFGENETK